MIKKKLCFTLLTIFISLFVFKTEVLAQFFPDPLVWQQQSFGLQSKSLEIIKGFRTTTNRKLAAGLEFLVATDSAPMIMVHGGITDAGWSRVQGQTLIDLGNIGIEGQPEFYLENEVTHWDSNRLAFTNGTANLEMTVSRLTPALLISQTSQNTLKLFTGNVYGDSLSGTTLNSRAPAPSYPKYVAYHNGSVQVSPLSQSQLDLSAIKQNWLLVWYGQNSHFVDSFLPLVTSRLDDTKFTADVPILMVFENKPTSIRQTTGEGGLVLSFSTPPNNVSLVPLYGRRHLPASETELWSNGLPEEVISQLNLLQPRLCYFPNSVEEAYSYNDNADTLTVNENFSFTSLCNGLGTKSASIPPILALSKEALGINFSQQPLDLKLPTEFGPYQVIDNTDNYSWSITGLKKLISVSRNPGSNNVPAEIQNELDTRIQKLLDTGHMAPWIFNERAPRHKTGGNIYWINPAQIIYHWLEIASASPSKKLAIYQFVRDNYVQNPDSRFQPQLSSAVPPAEGVQRTPFALNNIINIGDWQNYFPELFNNPVSLFNLYPLLKYYQLTGEEIPNSLTTRTYELIAQDMMEQDWATYFWFHGFSSERVAVENLNKHYNGTIAVNKLAQETGNQELSALGKYLLAKAAVAKIGMLKYPAYLSSTIFKLPQNPSWQPQAIQWLWEGVVFNYDWDQPQEDARTAGLIDQFGILLYDNSGFVTRSSLSVRGSDINRDLWKYGTSPHLSSYNFMSDELAFLLDQKASSEASVNYLKWQALNPDWYSSFKEGVLGYEHNLSFAENSFQVFMAEALLERENPDSLLRFVNVPWLETGDLFYIHKLAETARAYQGWEWTETPSPSTTPGCQSDINGDGTVNLGDVVAVLGSWGQSGGVGDLNGDGTVNLGDVVYILNFWGQAC